jgi:hypothetical protein
VALVLRLSIVVLVLYGGLIGLTIQFTTVPVGFIPAQDKASIVDIRRTAPLADAVLLRASEIIVQVPGVAYAVGIAALSGATRAFQCRRDLYDLIAA